jgi:hypothetical protein
MASLESSIDALYQGALDGFVAARNALAKSLTGDAALRVKQLPKPTSVAWAVNQLYWHERPVYDRLIKSGRRLRTAQLGALGGQRVNVREPADAHRAAVAQAVAETSKLATAAGLNPNSDELFRTFEALSLETAAGEPPGRLAKALHPAGFEALAGLVVNAPSHGRAARPKTAESASPKVTAKQSAAERLARDREETEAQREREEAQARRERAEAVKKAAAALARAQAAEDRARAEWERCKQERETAEQTLADLQ